MRTVTTTDNGFRCFTDSGKKVFVNLRNISYIESDKLIDTCSILYFIGGTRLIVDESITVIENAITNANPN